MSKGVSMYIEELKNNYPGFERFIDKLEPRRKHVIRERLKGRTLREVGLDLNVTPERVRQIEWMAYRHLMRYSRRDRKASL